ncbi:MAG: DUF1353 domain-containing protein [Betaproteobacteria bacterium]|nr:DUF1353 domain-containing protein [Betaproteobacteria bacterium]
MKRALLIVLALLSGVASGGETGHFEGRVVVEWLDDDPFVPMMRLVEDFSFVEVAGRTWRVPRGALLDERAMPPLFRDLVGSPLEGGFRKSALVYGYATQTMHEPWQDAQRMFFDAALAEGVDAPDAKAMYLVLHAQGSRWEVAGSRCYGTCHGRTRPLVWRPVVDEAKLRDLLLWVRAGNPGLGEIEDRARPVILERGPHIFPRAPCFDDSGGRHVRVHC